MQDRVWLKIKGKKQSGNTLRPPTQMVEAMMFSRHGSNNRHRCSERSWVMAEGGDGVGGTVGTSARNRLARRGSNAELLLWVSSNQHGRRGALEKKKKQVTPETAKNE